ncbi:MAG: hypothetical protein WA802_13310 [Terracidiphilus sp.]
MKFRQKSVAGGLVVLVMLLTTPAPAQSASYHLKPGDTMPALDGQALTGKWLGLPAAAGESPAVVMLSFSRAGGRDAQNWAQHLSKDSHLVIYTVIFLESVPRLFRPAAISGIRGGMPLAMQDRTILLCRDESLWKQRLQVTDESHAGVILLGSKGHIQWMTSGPFSDSLYLALSRQIRTTN